MNAQLPNQQAEANSILAEDITLEKKRGGSLSRGKRLVECPGKEKVNRLEQQKITK